MIIIDTTFLEYKNTGIYTLINQLLSFFQKENIEYEEVSYFKFYQHKNAKKWIYFYNYLLVKRIKKLGENDIFICPANLAGFYLFPHVKCKTFFFILDLFEFNSTSKVKNFINKQRFYNVCKNITRIITISELCKNEIQEFCKKLSVSIDYYYPFYNPHTEKKQNEDQIPNLLRKELCNTKFILANGSGQERKNVNFILENMKSINKDFNVKLVLFGRDFYQNHYREVFEKIHEFECDDLVLHIGDITIQELQWVYNHCECFVFPSLAEGFGLPPVEALLQGCKIAVSNIPIFYEILSPGKLFFDFSYESLKNTLEKILEMSKNDWTIECEKILEKFEYKNFKNKLLECLK